MSESPLPPSSKDDLQFTTAEPASSNTAAAAPGRTCIVCRQPIVSTYFALRDKVLCPTCCERVMAPPRGSKAGRLIKASFMGLGAGLVGALIWFAVRRVAHVELGLVAVLVGFMVGKAVRKGSGGRGGVGYQIMAVAITYFCIAANYMPDLLEAVLDGPNRAILAGHPMLMAQVAWIVLKTALTLPFQAGAENLIGLLIIGFALWEAWKFNVYRPLPISGPYQMGPGPAPATTLENVATNLPGEPRASDGTHGA
jgi:hypothetical protein